MALDTSNPQPTGQPGETSATGTTGWQYIRDLPTPPEVAERIEAKCRDQGWLWRWWNKYLLESWTKDLKLQYYYAGKTVALISTERGLAVIAEGNSSDDPAIAGLRDRLSREENERTAFDSFPPWNDDTSELLGCTSDDEVEDSSH